MPPLTARERHHLNPNGATPLPAARARDGWRAFARVAIVAACAGVLVALQDVVLAWRFATSQAMDAYQLAISFPTLALNVFAGGTLLAAMVPHLVQLDHVGRTADAAAFVMRARRAIAWVLLAVCAGWAVVFPAVVRTVAADASESMLRLSVLLTWLYLPVLWLYGQASVEAAVLNSRGSFGMQSAMPAFVPAGVIAGVLTAGSALGVVAATVGAVAGATALWLAVRRRASQLMSDTGVAAAQVPRLTSLARTYGLSALGAALLGGVLLWDTWIASTLAPGSAATYGYATRSIILLLAFGTTVVGNVLLPAFSRLAAAGDRRRLRRQFAGWCALLAISTAPLVVAGAVFAETLVGAVFERGTFTSADTAKVAAVLRVYVLQVPCFLVGMVGWRLLNGLQRYGALLGSATLAFLINGAVDVWLIPKVGLPGVAWGTVAAFASWAIAITASVFVASAPEARP